MLIILKVSRKLNQPLFATCVSFFKPRELVPIYFISFVTILCQNLTIFQPKFSRACVYTRKSIRVEIVALNNRFARATECKQKRTEGKVKKRQEATQSGSGTVSSRVPRLW